MLLKNPKNWGFYHGTSVGAGSPKALWLPQIFVRLILIRWFFWGQFSTNFDLKNMISTNTKGFAWNKWPTVGRFPETKFEITRLLWWIPVARKPKHRRVLFFNFHIWFIAFFWMIITLASHRTENKGCVTLWPCHLHLKVFVWQLLQNFMDFTSLTFSVSLPKAL
jgi:hypothetical protein